MHALMSYVGLTVGDARKCAARMRVQYIAALHYNTGSTGTMT